MLNFLISSQSWTVQFKQATPNLDCRQDVSRPQFAISGPKTVNEFYSSACCTVPFSET